jgi:aspartyl-tRNA(Asn)/glutamyl-tRNA(Gln) amidotransferase subunit B
MNKEYKPVIGLEIHVELKTKSKMFCQCDANYFQKDPNTNVCPVCLGLPGALPVPNKTAIEWTIKIAKALGCKINQISKFDRKHYFYPDLPKGYQISQYDEPIGIAGKVDDFGITRVHLEEDTGKLTHTGEDTLIDFNRSSVPLVEIVTEPDFENSEDVKKFLEELHTILRYLDVSDCDMEKGSMRLEPNISIRKPGETDLPKYKVEVKNINSFNYVKQAIDFEIKRQFEILEKGELPIQETRGYNEDKGITYSQRTKEGAADYRYFPEPDIPPMHFTKEYIDSITLPELPADKIKKYVEEFKIKDADARILVKDKIIAEYFEALICHSGTNEVSDRISTSKDKDAIPAMAGLQHDKLNPQQIANLIINKRIPVDISISEFVSKAKEILAPKETDMGLLDSSISKVLEINPKAIADFKSGKENVVMFLLGQVMREMKGKADANVVKEALLKKLSI